MSMWNHKTLRHEASHTRRKRRYVQYSVDSQDRAPSVGGRFPIKNAGKKMQEKVHDKRTTAAPCHYHQQQHETVRGMNGTRTIERTIPISEGKANGVTGSVSMASAIPWQPGINGNGNLEIDRKSTV